MQGIWAGVRERVEALAGLPGAAKVFGASNHRFVLAAPLAEEQLLSWEARVGTVLPDQFRAFLTEVAAAGAGPQYGLLGFEVADGIADWVGDHWRGPDRLNLRTEFPHQTEFRRPRLDTIPLPERFPSVAARAAAVRACAELIRACDEQDEADTHGTIPLCHHGCGYYDLLVVNGRIPATCGTTAERPMARSPPSSTTPAR